MQMDDYPRLVFHAHPATDGQRLYNWRFSSKDVIILFGIACAMSGLMGLGSIMVIDFVETLMTLS